MDYPSFFWGLGAWNWLIVGGLLMLLEIIVPGSFLIFLGLAAAAVGIIALNTDIAWQMQVVLFSIFSVAGVMLARMFWVPAGRKSDHPFLNERTKKLVGQTFTIVEPIENGRGKIRVGDTLWAVVGPDLPVGSKVVVTKTEGMTVSVEPQSN